MLSSSNDDSVGPTKFLPNRFRRQQEQSSTSKSKANSVAAILKIAAATTVVVTSLVHQSDQISLCIKALTPVWFVNDTSILESMPTTLTEEPSTRGATSMMTRTHPFARTDDSSLENDNSQKGKPLPLLSTLIGDQTGNITGDVQFLLDFAVVAFPKCGTTTFLQWMQDHDETLIVPKEVYALRNGRPEELVQQLYKLQPPNITQHSSDEFVTDYRNVTFRRGYKNPAEIHRQTAMQLISKYFSQSKLIVGVRHPILWFQSFYNYRIQSSPPRRDGRMLMPHPNRLIGDCLQTLHQVCTDSGLFHVYLAKLGKTNLTEEELGDESLQRHRDKMLENGIPLGRMPNPIFLYELNQLKQPRVNSSQEQLRSVQFRRDVQAFLELQHQLPPIPHRLPDRVWNDPQVQAYRDSQKIDICNDEFLPVRKQLMEQAQEASVWIRKYFLNAPGVFVSSRDYLESLLERWMYDPCDTTTETTMNTTQRW